jgi:hypothetical protein
MKEIKIYHRLSNGKFEKAVTSKKNDKRIGNASMGKKVIRLSDGKIYRSIQQCRIENDFCRYRIYNELKQGTNFKLIENERIN